MSAPSNMSTKTTVKFLSGFCLFILHVCVVSTDFGMSTDYGMPQFSPTDVKTLSRQSCIVVGKHSLSGQLYLIITELQNIFQFDGVTFGRIDFSSFVWPDKKTVTFKNKVTGNTRALDIAAFPKRRKDRTCLVEPPYEKNPDAYSFTGENSLEALVEFINTVCEVFRTSSGSLSPAGIHRHQILSGLFTVREQSDITMSSLYQSCGNPLNSSFISLADDAVAQRDTDTCYKSDQPTSKYQDPKEKITIPECERISKLPSQEEFFHNYLKISRPVIFENALSDWPAFSKWSNEFLRAEFGENDVHIKLTANGDYEGVEPANMWENFDTFRIPPKVKSRLPFPDLVVVRPATMDLKFSEFLDMVEEIAEQKSSNISAYLEYSSIPQYMPELQKDIKEFQFVNNLLVRKHLNIWLSDGHTLGRLHFDPFDNLLCQISGRKQVILFEPYDNTKLYEGHIPQATLSFEPKSRKFYREKLQDSTSMVMSPINILNPDFDRFPKFRDVQPLNCTLSEGDVMFMPSFWWHEVQSFPSTTEKRNLAINFWYEPFLTREFPCPDCQLDINPVYHHLL